MTGEGRGAPAALAAVPADPRSVGDLSGFADVVDFVEGTTAQIWDDKNPGLIAQWYTPTTVVHTSTGDIFGKDAVIESAILKMAAFPDIKDHVEDTIWTPTTTGFLTSMRWTWTGRNTGWSVWGAPTGRRVTVRGIANCVVRGGKYVEEWVAYDELSVLRQLGIPVQREVDRLNVLQTVSTSGGADTDRRLGQHEPGPLERGEVDDVEFAVRSGWHETWNRRMLGSLGACYAPGVVYHGPSGRELHGLADLRHDVLARLAMLPDARLDIDEFYAQPGAGGATRAAVRWTLAGTHTGPSRYGPPTGQRVRLLGLSHLRVAGGLVVEEWTVYSELDLLRQISPATPPG